MLRHSVTSFVAFVRRRCCTQTVKFLHPSVELHWSATARPYLQCNFASGEENKFYSMPNICRSGRHYSATYFAEQSGLVIMSCSHHVEENPSYIVHYFQIL